jgi:hypothetical protein
MTIQIYCESNSKRLKYILDCLIKNIGGQSYMLHHSMTDYLRASGPSIHYGNYKTSKENELLIPKSGYLNDYSKIPTPQIVFINQLPAGFSSNLNLDHSWKFDLLAFSFWHITRCEEYETFSPDLHNRFPASSSLAFKNNYLHIPFIDHWTFLLLQQLLPNNYGTPISSSIFPTFDVDIAFAFKHKNIWEQLGGSLKNILRRDLNSLHSRWSTFIKKKDDPFDTFDYLIHSLSSYPNAHFFFLAGKRSRFDRNLSPNNPPMIELIRKIERNFSVGIHPSYLSNDSIDILLDEIQTLSRITNTEITKSRQHYLKISFPATYSNLLEAGIKADFSMGFADACGFRLGTSFPVFWYNLTEEKCTDLLLTPFTLMDITLKKYLHLSPTEAITTIQQFKNTSPHFCFIWHNSNLSYIDHWTDWKVVFEELLNR